MVHHQLFKESEMSHETLSKLLMERRQDSPYEVDGIVVMHDDQHSMVLGKNPPYGFAMKSVLLHDEAEVMVTHVEWNQSKHGYLKPIVHFGPVVLAGVTIRKATGYNASYIEENQIGTGSRIVIIRSGDVIPKIVRIITHSASGKADLPTTAFHWTDTHVDAISDSTYDSDTSELKMKQLEHFAKTLEMVGVGPGIVKRLFEGGIDTVAKLIRSEASDIVKLEGFQERSATIVANSIAAAVERAKSNPIALMVASNLFGRGLGTRKLKPILEAFPSIIGASVIPPIDQITSIDGIGPATATEFLKGIPLFHKWLAATGLSLSTKTVTKPPTKKGKSKEKEEDKEEDNQDKGDKQFVGLRVVFTGVRDAELERLIESGGGSIGTSVSKNTTLVIAKDVNDTSAKVTKAKDLGIPISTLSEFKDKNNIH